MAWGLVIEQFGGGKEQNFLLLLYETAGMLEVILEEIDRLEVGD